ncbi:hypothetical protein BH10ACI1_BH10ACI1_07680 [soil metagenome]
MFKFIFCILLLTSAVFFSACGGIKSTELPEVVINDNKPNTLNEVVITDEDIINSTRNSNGNGLQATQTNSLADNSEIVTMFDGYGNKTEKRYFNNNSRLELVMVRTAVDGRKQIIVYGFGTEIITMPDDFAGIALNASADEIANAAKLKNTRPFKPSFITATLTPIPSSQTVTKPVVQVEKQENIADNEAEQTNIQDENSNNETEKPATDRRNTKPE